MFGGMEMAAPSFSGAPGGAATPNAVLVWGLARLEDEVRAGRGLERDRPVLGADEEAAVEAFAELGPQTVSGQVDPDGLAVLVDVELGPHAHPRFEHYSSAVFPSSNTSRTLRVSSTAANGLPMKRVPGSSTP